MNTKKISFKFMTQILLLINTRKSKFWCLGQENLFDQKMLSQNEVSKGWSPLTIANCLKEKGDMVPKESNFVNDSLQLRRGRTFCTSNSCQLSQ